MASSSSYINNNNNNLVFITLWYIFFNIYLYYLDIDLTNKDAGSPKASFG